MNAILALDSGTSSARAIVFDGAGCVISRAQREITQYFPQPGWVEHDAVEIWQAQREVAKEAIAKATEQGVKIVGIGITNQRETTVLWDKLTGQPVAPAIVWQDRRTAGYCQTLIDAGMGEMVRAKTGLMIDAYFSGSKLKWLLDHVPNARERAKRGELLFGTIDSWLIYNLTLGKVHATDVSNAARTMLFNIHSLEWDQELLTLMNIDDGAGGDIAKLLPQIVSSSGVIGETTCEGLPHGIPIAGIAGDQQAALFGQGCHRAGMAKNTYGTGCFLLMNTGDIARDSRHKLLTTVAWRIDHSPVQYALEGSVFIAGAAVQWLRDGLGIIKAASDMMPLAISVDDTDGVVFVPTFTGLGTPYWDPNTRGTIFGLTRGTTKAHIARATLEAIAFQSADVLHAMQEDLSQDATATSPASPTSLTPLTTLKVDGGAASNNLLMQFQADILGIPVTSPAMHEATALGAACLAGLAVGVWKSSAELPLRENGSTTWHPKMSPDEAKNRMARWHKAVTLARGWV